MIIKELIYKYSLEEIAEEFRIINAIPRDKSWKVLGHLKSLLEKFENLNVEEQDKILMVSELLEDPCEDALIHYDVTCFHMDELINWRKSPHFQYIFPEKEVILTLTSEELNEIFRECNLPESYCFMFTPWEESLGFQINEENVKNIGALKYIVAFIEEITFFGIDEEEVQVKRDELQESIDESERIRALPKDEQQNYYKSAEEVFKELGYEDKRTAEEKAENYLEISRKTLENRIRTSNFLKKL